MESLTTLQRLEVLIAKNHKTVSDEYLSSIGRLTALRLLYIEQSPASLLKLDNGEGIGLDSNNHKLG